MRITWLRDVEPGPARRVAVGEFDGVHVGHRAVIAGSDTVLTFEPHPRLVVDPTRAPKLLTSLETKAELIAELGIAELIVVPFDAAFAALTPSAFIDRVLVGTLRAQRVSVGRNFRFGHRAAGDASTLAARTEFETHVAALVEVDGEPVSSTQIRSLLGLGEVERAARLLGAPFRIRGEVVSGDRRGRSLGYPTANLIPNPALVLPAHGVYAARATVDTAPAVIPAAVSIGVRPTFDAGGRELIEAYLIDWDGDLYRRVLRVELLARLRGERAFASAAALVEQMDRDVSAARALMVG